MFQAESYSASWASLSLIFFRPAPSSQQTYEDGKWNEFVSIPSIGQSAQFLPKKL